MPVGASTPTTLKGSSLVQVAALGEPVRAGKRRADREARAGGHLGAQHRFHRVAPHSRPAASFAP